MRQFILQKSKIDLNNIIIEKTQNRNCRKKRKRTKMEDEEHLKLCE
jgi:hypothetical protein